MAEFGIKAVFSEHGLLLRGIGHKMNIQLRQAFFYLRMLSFCTFTTFFSFIMPPQLTDRLYDRFCFQAMCQIRQ